MRYPFRVLGEILNRHGPKSLEEGEGLGELAEEGCSAPTWGHLFVASEVGRSGTGVQAFQVDLAMVM